MLKYGGWVLFALTLERRQAANAKCVKCGKCGKCGGKCGKCGKCDLYNNCRNTNLPYIYMGIWCATNATVLTYVKAPLEAEFDTCRIWLIQEKRLFVVTMLLLDDNWRPLCRIDQSGVLCWYHTTTHFWDLQFFTIQVHSHHREWQDWNNQDTLLGTLYKSLQLSHYSNNS